MAVQHGCSERRGESYSLPYGEPLSEARTTRADFLSIRRGVTAMQEWTTFGKVLIGLGLGIVVLGIVVILADRVPGVGQLFSWLGKLPGDVSVKREDFSFYFPIATSLLLSVVLSLLFFLLGWLFRR